MHSKSHLIFEFSLFLFLCLMILGLPLGTFYYSLKRNFRIRLFNFADNIIVIFFTGYMFFFLFIFVFFSLNLPKAGNLYQRLMTSGITTEAKIFYQAFRPGPMSFEVGVDFFDLSGTQHKHFVQLDPVNYFLISKERSLRIHYHQDAPEKIILDDFPPRINPMEIILIFSSGLLLVIGCCMWIKRNKICSVCQDLNTHVEIRTSNDLRKILEMAQRYVADGTLSVLHESTPASSPFDRINPDGPWFKDLEYLFQCNTCRIEFGLSCRPFRKGQGPYTGTAGRWSPK